MILLCILFFSLLEASLQATYTLREVEFSGGCAGTNSIYSASWKAENAFLKGSNEVWHSGRNFDGTGDLHYSFPHLIWYKFPASNAFIPARVSFKSRPTSRAGCGNHGCAATKYQFIASNDPSCNEYSKWTVICEDLSRKGISKVNSEAKYCDVDPNMRESFTCLGVSVLDSTYSGASEVSINGMRMWARE